MSASLPANAASDDFISLCAPEIRGNEWKYVKDCLDTAWVSSVGAYVERFEREVASYVGSKHAVAVVNGTAGIHAALLVAGVRPDDEVLVSSMTFIAPVNAIRYAQAWPVFVDCEPEFWQMDIAKVGRFLEEECVVLDGELRNRRSGRRVSALLPVHVLGDVADLDALLALARRFNLIVIEDATECLGARYKGRRAGSFGHAGVFSFNGNKIITTGGGGMVVTDNSDWAARLKHLTTQAKADPIEFVHDEVGFNYRLTNIQAAMGCAQMEVIDEYIAAKRRIAATYDEHLNRIAGLTPMRQAPYAESICWMYTMLVDEKSYGEDSRALLRRLGAAKIQARPLWQPAHLSPAHASSMDQTKCPTYPCNVAERLYRDALSLPCSVGLTAGQQQRVIEVIDSGKRVG